MPFPYPSLLPTPRKRNLSDWGERSCTVLRLSVKSDWSVAQGPKKSQMYLLCSPYEKTGFRSLNLKCRFSKCQWKWKIPETTSCNIPRAAAPWSALWLEWPWVCDVTLAVGPSSGALCGGAAEPSLCHVGNGTTHPARAWTWKLGGFWELFVFGTCLLQHMKAEKDCHGNCSWVFFQCFPILFIFSYIPSV